MTNPINYYIYKTQDREIVLIHCTEKTAQSIRQKCSVRLKKITDTRAKK